MNNNNKTYLFVLIDIDTLGMTYSNQLLAYLLLNSCLLLSSFS